MAQKILNNDGIYTYLEGLKVKKIHPTAEELTKTLPRKLRMR